MKTCDEMFRSLLTRRDRYEAEQKRKKSVITRIAASACCLGLAAWLGWSVLSGSQRLQEPGIISGSQPELQKGESPNEKETKPSMPPTAPTDEDVKGTEPGMPPTVPADADVIWGNDPGRIVESGGFRDDYWNGKHTDLWLYDVLSSEENHGKIMAIEAVFAVDWQFVFEGKTIAELDEEAKNEGPLRKKLEQLRKLGNSLKYGEALYQTGTPSGEKWVKSLYEETVEMIGMDVIDKYIVDGVFLQEELNNDLAICKSEPCEKTYQKALAACFQLAADAAANRLESQNIPYERRNRSELIIFSDAETFASLEINGVHIFRLAAKNQGNEPMVYSE